MATKKELRRRVAKCLLAEDEEGALAAVEALLALDPNRAEAWADVGFLLADAGRGADAMRHFDRALELDPRCAAAWVGKGKELAGEAALRCFDEAIAAKADYDGAWFLKSVVLGELGRRDEAARCLAKARALSPGTYG